MLAEHSIQSQLLTETYLLGVPWCTFGKHKHVERAVNLFEQMKLARIRPDIAFVGMQWWLCTLQMATSEMKTFSNGLRILSYKSEKETGEVLDIKASIDFW